MRPLVLIGVIVLVLGVASLFVSVPRRETEGIKVGGVTAGVEVKHSERLPVWASAVLIVGGIAMAIAGGRGKA